MFDGMHRGHLKVVEEVKKEGDSRRTVTGILTFWPHPSRVLQEGTAPPVLMAKNQKIEFLAEVGIDFAVVLAFTKEFARTDPETFFEKTLVEGLGVQCVVVGEDYVFGRKARGDVNLLRSLGQKRGVDILSVPPVLDGGERISSSRIRTLIMESGMKRAEELLGRPYVVWGEVVPGKARGARMGFPTANVFTQQEVLPRDGVYVGETMVEDQVYLSLINLGCCPTFEDVTNRRLEVHLISLDRDLYGERCGVRFLKRLRDEMLFKDERELMLTMINDKKDAIGWAAQNRRHYPLKNFFSLSLESL